jgi:hypothetical protein
MNRSETDAPTPSDAPVEHPGVDRGDWSRVRIPGGQQGHPHTHRRRPKPHPATLDDKAELDAFDDFDAYDQTTSG